MIKSSIKIGDGEIVDLEKAYSMIYAGSDDRFSPPVKDFQTTEYADEEGINIYPKTVDDSFDHNVRFFVSSDSISDANDRIIAFNSALYTQVGDIKTFKQVEFYCPYKKAKVVGIPTPIELANDFWRDSIGRQSDKVMVDFIIKVGKPSLCDFNYSV